MSVSILFNNEQTILGLNQEQRDTIKEALTFENPAYKNAKRFGKSRYISIPPYLTYYSEKSYKGKDGVRHKALTIPIGVNVMSICDDLDPTFLDERVEHKVEYPKFNLTLRDDQQKAEDFYLSQCGDKPYSPIYPKNLLQLPTGKGKSILALHIAYKLRSKTLILVHKDDLVVGWKKDIELCFGKDLEVGLIKAKSRKVGEQITIATVQTLSRMSEEELSKYTEQFGLVVQDEAHHVGLNIFNIINKFSSPYKLGLSATPTRADGLDFVFDLFFGGLGFEYEYDPNDKDILPVEVRVKKSNFRYKPFMWNNQIFNYYDFRPDELPKNLVFVESMGKDRPTIPFLTIDNEVVTSREYKIMVCKDIIGEYRKGRSCIALFTQKEHINIYYKYLSRYISKDKIMLYYGDSKEKSEDMMKKAEDKEVLVTLATYAKATEGTNVKSWEVEFLVSSVKQEKNVEQATGRIRRSKEGKINPVIVYDYNNAEVYSIRNHLTDRLKAYKRLNYKVIGDISTSSERGMFSRGYKK